MLEGSWQLFPPGQAWGRVTLIKAERRCQLGLFPLLCAWNGETDFDFVMNE